MQTDPAAFLKRLEASGLLTDSIADVWPQLTRLQSAEDAVSELIEQSLLTGFQADVLLKGEAIPLVIGEYIVRDMIGRGGMGLVLKARHQRMRRTVAIKFLLKSMAPSKSIEKRFEREVQAAAQLEHTNIVTAYDAGVHEDGSYYLVMQYVEGHNLSAFVRKQGPLPVPLAVHAVAQAADGLAYAHERGIIHRDVKPGNLLLDHQGVVRVLDMGLARIRPAPGEAIDDEGGHADLTSTGSVMGTVDFMAPEQALDARLADGRADIYGLGCTLYYLLTGNPPYVRDTIMMRLLAHREEDIPSLRVVRPEVPPELDRIYTRMLAKKPEDRHVSMQQLLDELKALNLAGSSPDVLETLEQPISDSNASSIEFASADGDSDDGSSGRGSESPQPGVVIKAKPLSPPQEKARPASDQQPTVEFDTADTDLREQKQQRRRPAAKAAHGQRKRRKRLRRKRASSPEKLEPVLRRGRSREEEAREKPRQSSARRVVAWLLEPSLGVSRIFFVGIALAAIVVPLLMSGPKSGESPVPDADPDVSEVPGVTGPRRQRAVAGDYALKFGLGATQLVETDGIKLHGGSPLTMEARISPQAIPAGTRATILQFPAVARLFIHSHGATWSVGCALVNEAGTAVESLSKVQHEFESTHHVAAVWNLTTLKTFVDGVDEGAWEFLPNPLKSHEGATRIGIDLGGKTKYSGLIDEFRISNAIRYTERFKVPKRHRTDEYTLALYHFDAGEGVELVDSSANDANASITSPEWVLIQERAADAEPPRGGGPRALRPVRELNSPATDGYCWVSPDGLTIYFTREGIAESGIWKSQRITTSHAFAMPQFVTRVRHIAFSGDESIAVALMGYDRPAELGECNRRFLRDAALDFQPIGAFSDSQTVKSPWLTRNGLTLVFQRRDKLDSYAGGASPLSSRTEFVVSNRVGHDLPWSEAQRLPLEKSPALSKPLTWPMLTDDSLALLFCHGANIRSDIMIATRDNPGDAFGNVQHIVINGEPLQGRAPRYIESTRELFITRMHDGSDTDWDLYVVPEFDVDTYR